MNKENFIDILTADHIFLDVQSFWKAAYWSSNGVPSLQYTGELDSTDFSIYRASYSVYITNLDLYIPANTGIVFDDTNKDVWKIRLVK